MQKEIILLTLVLSLLFASNVLATTTVTVLYPNGGESHNWANDSTLDGNFRIVSNDSNHFLIDFNVSTSTSQGTGTVVLNDINTFTSNAYITGCTGNLDYNVAGVGRDCNFSIPVANLVADGNYYLFVAAQGTSSGFDRSNAVFGLFSAYIPTYGSGDIDDVAVDLVGTILVALKSNAASIFGLIIILYIIGVLTGTITGVFNIFRGVGFGK